jgi:hypothetical protein
MKEWFKHDYKSRTHPRLQRIQMKYGMEGVGLYWCVCEMLYEQEGVLMRSQCDSYAFALRVPCELLTDFIENSGAFIFEGDLFYSATVNERLSERESKSKKASLSALRRWNDANALRNGSDRNAIREEKKREEERREEEEKKETRVRVRFSEPSVDDVSEILERREAEKFVAFYTSKDWRVGKTKMKDWRAAARGWKLRNTNDKLDSLDRSIYRGDAI